ncbi:MAG: SDR family oxidoreductase [Candidatus Paceibacterota bacterium]|jgi:NAD(P)-dependent dehydrogenase (short-subunit alcohol dehydrogenase family)
MGNTKGKVCLITGATSGIGKEAAIALARSGMRVVFTARAESPGESTRKEIKEKTGADADYLLCDLSSLDEVRKLTEEFQKKYNRLDVLINNAGVGETELKFSKDNIEMDMAVNYFAPFLLTGLLLPALKKSAPSRIINVSSMMHAEGHIDFDNLTEGKNFERYDTYAQSKLALLLFTRKLAADLKGTDVTVNAMHPGIINTKITKELMNETNFIVKSFFRLKMISEEKAGDGIAYLATNPNVEGMTGEYFDRTTRKRSSDESYDMEIAERLWAETERILRHY